MCGRYPGCVYQFFVNRLRLKDEMDGVTSYRAIPYTYISTFDYTNLKKVDNYDEICEFLWSKATGKTKSKASYEWLKLFHQIVMEDIEFWKPKLLGLIDISTTLDDLHDLVSLIEFKGSLIIIRVPEVAKAFLIKAKALAGDDGCERIGSSLYVASGSDGRSYTNGKLKSEDDYLEAEAVKAAKEHADDPVLEPYYRKIIEYEQNDRIRNREMYRADEMDEY